MPCFKSHLRSLDFWLCFISSVVSKQESSRSHLRARECRKVTIFFYVFVPVLLQRRDVLINNKQVVEWKVYWSEELLSSISPLKCSWHFGCSNSLFRTVPPVTGYLILGWCESNCNFGLWILNHYLNDSVVDYLIKYIFINQNGNHFNHHNFAHEKCLIIPVAKKNPCFRIHWTLGKHFLLPAGCGSVFPMKSFRDAWGNGGWLMRAQVNIANEAKFHSPICSMFEALVVPCVVWHCRSGKEWGPFCWPMLAADTAIFSPSHGFAEHTSQM